MENISKCLNEWNATIEALGQGKQTILIRKYTTTNDKFFLYPTVSYAHKLDYLDSFEKEYQTFAEANAFPKIDKNKTEVKYFATLDKIIEKPAHKIGALNKYHIWTNKHVKSYLNNEKAHVWILRVFKLKKPVIVGRTKGRIYANLIEKVSLNGIKPVLSDEKFSKIVKEIE